MANGYMPRRDSLALQWMTIFADRLVADPSRYFVSPVEAASVAEAVGTFAAAFTLANSPRTRTSPAVLRKDECRASGELACRSLYLRIKCNPAISDGDKVSAGVRPTNPARTRIGPPAAAPIIRLTGISTSGHTIEFADFTSPVRRSKPTGATQLQLFRRFDDHPTDAMGLVGCFTRWPIRIDYDVADNGRTAIYAARWMTRRGETSPWSNMLTVPVVALAPNYMGRQSSRRAA
jgi:hypothetical protein